MLGTLIIGKCEKNKDIIFQKSLCSGFHRIPFSSRTIHNLLNFLEEKPATTLEYEILNLDNKISIQFILHQNKLKTPSKWRTLLQALHIFSELSQDSPQVLYTWNYEYGENLPKATSYLNDFFEYEYPFFENELRKWLTDPQYKIQSFPVFACEDLLEEGKKIEQLTQKYERNLLARKKCIAHYGCTCKICNFNFEEKYGASFASIIEVHHIFPLHLIGENYIVDPVRDLIPVCANCHRALHSKPNGVYSPEEMRKIIQKTV